MFLCTQTLLTFGIFSLRFCVILSSSIEFDIFISAPSVTQFWDGTKAPNSITIYWKNVRQVGLFTLQYYPAETQKPSRWFSVPIKNETLPATYERRISALSSCTKYKFVLRAYPSSKCGITEVFTQEVLTKESRKYSFLCIEAQSI